MAIFFANISDSINLSYSLAKDYKAYPFTLNPTIENANKFALRILLLNKSVFGNTEFQILDKRLFSTDTIHNKTSKIILRDQGQQTNVQEYEVCVPITILGWYCGTPDDPACKPRCDYCGNQCHVTMQDATECTDLYPTGGGGGGPTGGGGTPTGGSGGGGTTGIPYDPPPCNPNPTNPSIVGSNVVPGGPLPPCPPPGGGAGWLPIILNPLVAFPIILDTSITNNFPCVQRIIDSLTSFMSINAIAQKALHEVFNIDKKIHTTFKIDWNLTKDSADGLTSEDVFLSNNNSSNDYYSTIKLNPWMLNNSTQEYIASTIIHEASHSYIDYKYYQYTNNIIDSNEYKSLFPLYWPPRTGSYILSASANRQHKIMATSLIEIMASPISSINSNPGITAFLRDSINRALAWGGLHETTVWRTKSDTNDIKAINAFARDTSVLAPFQLIINGSPSGTIYTNDSHTFHMKKGCQ